MATTIKQLIKNAIRDAMAAIAVSSSDEMNVQKAQKVGKAAVNISEHPSIVVDEVAEDQRWHIRDAYEGVMHLEIRGHVRKGNDNERAEAAADLQAAMIKRLGVDESWGGLANFTRMTGVRTNLEEPSEPIGSVILAVDVTYRTERTNPYLVKVI